LATTPIIINKGLNQMDTTNTTPSVVEVTRTELYTATQYAELEAKLAQVETQFAYLKSVNDRLSARDTSKANMIDSVKDYLIENYGDLELHADEIATLLDIELEREVEYTVSMSATVTVTVKMGEDGEDLITDSLFIDSSYGNITVDEYNVDTVYEA
jgi:hypothetical protein